MFTTIDRRDIKSYFRTSRSRRGARPFSAFSFLAYIYGSLEHGIVTHLIGLQDYPCINYRTLPIACRTRTRV